MKLKPLSLSLLLATTIGSAYGQSAQIKAGINFANVSITDDGSVSDAKQLTSFHVGIIGDFSLGSKLLSLQSGLLFTGKGSKTESEYPTIGPYSKQTFNPKYIEIPATLVFKLPVSKSRLFAGAGPYLGIGVGGKNKTLSNPIYGNNATYVSSEYKIRFSNDDPTTANEDEGAGFGILRRFDYGLNGTAGVESESIVLSLNYGYGLAKLQSGSNSSANDKNKHRVLSLSVGFKF